jgi:hypothetical protein
MLNSRLSPSARKLGNAGGFRGRRFLFALRLLSRLPGRKCFLK